MSSPQSFLDLSNYKIEKSIGEGSYGYVYLVKDIKTQKIYAAKISKEKIIEKKDDDAEDLLYLFREIKIMSALDHPSIIQYVGYNPKNFQGEPNPTIITEYASNGTLGSIIQSEMSKKPPQNWNDTKKLICIYGIASGMAYLHRNNVIHRDLKPDNILMDEDLYPRITDFGLSKITGSIYASLNIQSQAGIKGSPLFMAPEIMCEESYSNGSDVYAFSMIVYILITGLYPFTNVRSIVELMKKLSKGIRPKIPSETPQAYAQLIERCWSQDVDDRPSFEEIANELKNNEDFITENVDRNEFKKFIDLVDSHQSSFDISKNSFHFNNFIATDKNETKEVQPEKAQTPTNADHQNNIISHQVPNTISNAKNPPTNSNGANNIKDTPKPNPNPSNNAKSPASSPNTPTNTKSSPASRNSVNFDGPSSEKVSKKEYGSADVRQVKSSSMQEAQKPAGKLKKSHTFVLPQSPPLFDADQQSNPLNKKAFIQLKVSFIGDLNSGKQQLVYCLANRQPPDQVTPSNGPIEFVHEYFNEYVKFELNDTTGQEDFIISRMNSYANTNIFFYVFSMIDKETLKNIVKKWNNDVNDFRDESIIFLIGVGADEWEKDQNNKQYATQQEIEEVEQTIGANVVLKCSFKDIENMNKIKNKMIDSYVKFFYNKDESDESKKKKKSKKEIDFKVLIVGNNNSGQSELLDYIEKQKILNDNQKNSIRKVTKQVSIHGKKVNLNLFSTPGEEDLQAIRLLTYQNSDVIMMVFSLIKKDTFYAVMRKYLKEAKSFANQAAVILVGVDMEKWEKNDYNRDFVHESELQIVRKDPEVQQVILCSYVTGENFDKIPEKIVEAYQMKTNDKSCNIA